MKLSPQEKADLGKIKSDAKKIGISLLIIFIILLSIWIVIKEDF